MAEDKNPYWVAVREVHIQYYKVDAASPREAIDLINQRLRTGILELTSGAFEYSHTMGTDTWTAERT